MPIAATPPPILWRPPVPGQVVRAFSYGADPFARGWHRGVDLRAAPGATVRAACGGRVVTAMAGRVVTLRCGPWRVTHLPLARVTVRAGERVAPGTRLGTLGASPIHHGLHLGVRRTGDPFGYVDPLPFLRAARPPAAVPPPAPPPRRTRPGPLRPAGPPSLARPARVRVPTGDRLAPWPVWIGLALALSGAFGGGVRWRLRARRVRAPAPAREAVR